MQNEKRIIIGQTEIAGLPISAPVAKNGVYLSNGIYLLWQKRKDGSFSLVVEERSSDDFGSEGSKQEVPFVE